MSSFVSSSFNGQLQNPSLIPNPLFDQVSILLTLGTPTPTLSARPYPQNCATSLQSNRLHL